MTLADDFIRFCAASPTGGRLSPLRRAPTPGAAARRGGPQARARGRAKPSLDADGIVGLANCDVDAPVRAHQAGGRLRRRSGHRAQPDRLALDLDVVAVQRITGPALGHDGDRPGAVVAALSHGWPADN